VGIGWNAVEFEALGFDFADRAERYEEQIQLMRALWTQPVLDYTGRFHRVDRAGILPLPRQRPVPVWMGGGPSPGCCSASAGSPTAGS
jgi:alkanesulfonate monooxygenase SsuD/methylene tetrahydromethanopterin reductase-like flavin-dependent oxidoreductase (luciferase family)